MRDLIEQIIKEKYQLQELSRATLDSYKQKARKSLDKHDKIMSREEDKAMSTDGNKYPEKQARHLANVEKSWKKFKNRSKGIERAVSVKKTTNEENIQEVSKKTLGNYLRRSAFEVERNSFGAGIKRDLELRGNPRAGKERQEYRKTVNKRQRGIYNATNKLTGSAKVPAKD